VRGENHMKGDHTITECDQPSKITSCSYVTFELRHARTAASEETRINYVADMKDVEIVRNMPFYDKPEEQGS